MDNVCYLYDMMVLTEFNINNFDTVQHPYSKTIRIMLSKRAFKYKEKSELIENKISKIFSNKKEKVFFYKTGIEMKIDKDNILIYYDKKNDFPERNELLYRISMGNGLISLLRFNNNFVIHGTAIYNKNNVFALIGKSGLGKSTIASYLVKNHNYGLISDDKIVLNDNFEILAGSKVVRLWEDSFKNIINSINTNCVYSSLLGENKKYINLEIYNHGDCVKEKNFKYNFIILENNELSDFPMIEKISKSELFCYFLKNVYDYDTLTKSELNKEITQIKELIDKNKINGYKLTYKYDYSQLDKIFELINEVGDYQ